MSKVKLRNDAGHLHCFVTELPCGVFHKQMPRAPEIMASTGLIICLLLFIPAIRTGAQEIESTSTYNNINSGKYLRICLDNDYFSGSDKQYTEGFSIEYWAPLLGRSPLAKLLYYPRLSNMDVKYGMEIEQDSYTPDNMKFKVPLTNDRPYAATLLLKTFMVATDNHYGQRFASTFTAGVIGPAAMGRDIQTGAHIIFDNLLPAGWGNQVHNDIVINYQLDYQKQVLSYGNLLSADVDIMGRAGTLSDKTCVGVTFMTGKFQSPFTNSIFRKRTLFYVYVHPEINFIGYDATLEGGAFNKASPYTLSSNEIARRVFKNNAGIVIFYNNLYVEYFYCYQSRQFLKGNDHAWNGIRISMALK